MPTYEYKCSACGHKFEKFQSITSAPIRKCPECQKNKAKRLIGTGAGLIFKGSGFYITDYRSENYKQGAKADSGSTPATDTKKSDAPTTTDAKPATKSEGKSDSAPAPKPEPKPAPKPEPKPETSRKGKKAE